MCELLFTHRGDAGCWYEYYLLVEKPGAFRSGEEMFGVKLVSSDGERAAAAHLTASYEKIIGVLTTLVRRGVTPRMLSDVILELAVCGAF
ncbi:MAG: hypothetical protein IJA73_01825 [Oscillospiraceae bacterium]|nr:hypothetical protein [Oscillospiraceae bacterium]